ncbi:MAG: hypothetical protein JW819_01550 [Candidatus Krumholzibacteriota bacterium]|nr:hypothetical protein [Candidatus Krumholzibacteriota bacterium]
MRADARARLADSAALRAADPGDMLGKVAAFPERYAAARDAALPALPADRAPSRILVGGMGGSGIAGALVAGWLDWRPGPPRPLLAFGGYELPPTAPGDLLVLCSHSGDTEEVLALLAAALARPDLPMVPVAAGGRLAARAADARAAGAPVGETLILPGGMPPRAALPAMLGRLLALLARLGWPSLAAGEEAALRADLAAVAADCGPGRPPGENPAKDLALALGDAAPVCVALAPAYAPVARRLRCQFEENAKRAARDLILPELHHNSWVPWTGGDSLGAALWLGEADAHPRTRRRRELSEAALAAAGLPALALPARGGEPLARLLTTVLLGDFLSVYHALMRDVDPTPVDALAAMKARLADEE